jgi:aspartate/methionine/tyrosine aminotransferase
MAWVRPNRLQDIPGIGVDRMGDAADALADPAILRLENMDTDLRPHPAGLEATRRAIDLDPANSYLPFLGQDRLRRAATAHVVRLSGVEYDWRRSCVISAGGCSGVLNTLLATIDPGDKVVLTSPVYAGLVNRVRLAGGVPVFARLLPGPAGWRLDLDGFSTAVAQPGVKAVLMVSPSMPTGAVLNDAEWHEVARLCVAHDLLLINDAAMERILFDGAARIHPASLPGMAERSVTIGTASKELRMIGWRVGWVVGPPEILADIGLVGMANVVCQVGIAMDGVAAALEAPEDNVLAAIAEWQRRCRRMLAELDGLPVIPPQGGWSMLLDCEKLGLTGAEAANRLLSRAGIAATPMSGWGLPETARYLRFVFANESAERLAGMGDRVRSALG